MEQVNKLFGAVQIQKVCTCKVEALGAQQDAYVAKLNNGTTDQIAMIAMVPHDDSAMSLQVLSQVNWDSLHVRSYTSKSSLEASLAAIASKEVLAELQTQIIVTPDWGNDRDLELNAIKATSSCTTYGCDAQLPFAVTLHSIYSDNKHGTELENDIEFIPALTTYNFTLTKA